LFLITKCSCSCDVEIACKCDLHSNLQVSLPPGESCAGWVAVHAIDFYNEVSTIWAVM
jgi:hypothetical protein